jgi:lipopolysaccharide transport system ATP-binding protein
MKDVAIRVDNLGKRYFRRRARVEETSLKEALAGAPRLFLDNFFPRRPGKQYAEESFWALQGFSFELNQGQALGVIGKNGSGKTTLLKILARTTKPTVGSARLWGNVGALLDVATGFHPELTGRENIYLNGIVLGMTKRDIERKFDEIVYFSGVGDFVDMPIKRYSSGMQVRLAFSVAAHLEADILLLDEVLAVGDAEFRRKSMKKTTELIRSGATAVIVSHDPAAVADLCDLAILLRNGRLVFLGNVLEALDMYRADQDNF